MKISIFISSLQGGGAERVAITLANSFIEKGHNVDLVLIRAEGAYLEQGMISPQVHIVSLNARRTRYALWPWIKYLLRAKPDAILSLLTDINLVALSGRMLFARKAKLVVSERSTISQETRHYAFPQLFYKIAVSVLYPFANRIICVSRACAKDLQTFATLPEKSIEVIFNPVDLIQIAEKMQAPVAHPWLQPGQPPVILAVGRLENAKNFPLLLSTFAKMRDQMECRLIILGEGSLRQQLHKLTADMGISEDVDMPGFCDNPYAYMARAAVFVLSSHFEGLPNVLVEALACGCPVVSTDCPSGPAEILEGGKYGMLVPVDDVRALADAIQKTLQGINVCAKEGRIHRASFFAKDIATARYLELLS